MEIKEMPKALGISGSEFCRRYKIPRPTYQKWVDGLASPPTYVLFLLEQAVLAEVDRTRKKDLAAIQSVVLDMSRLDSDKREELIRLIQSAGWVEA